VTYLGTILTFIFVENVVLTYFLGICPFLISTGSSRTATVLSLILTLTMGLLSLLTWAVRHWILVPLNAEYLQLIVFALLIGGTSQLLFSFVRRWSPRLISVTRRYFVLLIANASLFGVLLISSYRSYGPLESFLAAISAGVGAMLALVGLAAVRERLEYERVPAAFRGGPILLISAGLFSLAFHAFDKLLLLRLLGN
jgi:electron transport complex protein RnfA